MLFALLFAEGPSRAQVPSVSPRPTDAELVERRLVVVRESLKDPESARFSEVRLSRRGGFAVVCGFVNSKNGYGGYAGKERFISLFGGGETFFETEISRDGMDGVWGKFC